MTDTQPLLKHKEISLQPESEVKIFMTANELLRHVRNKYNLSVSLQDKLEGKVSHISSLDQQFVSNDIQGQSTDHQVSKENITIDTYADYKSKLDQIEDKTEELPRKVQPDISDNQHNLRQSESTTQYDHFVYLRDDLTNNLMGKSPANKIDLKSKNRPTIKNKKQHFYTTSGRESCFCKPFVTRCSSHSNDRGDERQKMHETRSSMAETVGSKKCYHSIPVLPQGTNFHQDGKTEKCCQFYEKNKLTMASLQSARTQCCCCAVGVFAAMFGIFMLSAGICIVLNVTFMEVDTSGLPPNLHNESGKKVVGIILICVAIAFLGLSATVSVLYFTLCTRKSRTSTPSSINNGSQPQQKRNGFQSGPDSGKIESGPNKKMIPPHPDGNQHSKTMPYHRPDKTKQKAYRSKHNKRHNVITLYTHEEDDRETGKSTTDLHAANETHPRRSSHGKILIQKSTEEGSMSVVVVNPNSKPPTIMVDDFTARSNILVETHLNDTMSVYEEDSISNIYSEHLGDSASVGGISPYETFRSGYTSRSFLQSSGAFTQRSFDDSEIPPPPELPHNIEVRTDLSLSDFPYISTLAQSQADTQPNLLTVKPAKGADLVGTSSSSSDTLDTVFGEDRDNLSDLPFGHHSNQTVYKNRLEEDVRSESRSSFNSAFSFDGDDPVQSEMERLRTKNENILEGGGSKGDK